MADAIERTIHQLRSEGNLVQAMGPGPLGFADLLAIHPDAWGAALIIATTPRSEARQLRAALEAPALRTWLLTGGRCLVFTWSSAPGPGGRVVWTVSRRNVFLSDLVPPIASTDAPVPVVAVGVDLRDIDEAE